MRWTIVLMPWPSPMHIVARPSSASFCSIVLSSVVVMRAPEQPSGWPSAIAPPFRLTFVVVVVHQAEVLDHRQRLRGERLVQLGDLDVLHRPCFARASAFFVAGTGP